MVDWEPRGLARAPGSPATGPRSAADEAAAVVAELRAGADRSTALVRDFTGLDAGERTAPGPGRRPPRLDPGQRRRLRHAPRAGHRQARRDARGRPDRRRPRRSAPGSPAPRSGGLLGFLASKVLGPVRPVLRPARPAAAGRAQHRPRRARARGRPDRLPALGLPARGDPPRAVHRGAVDARPPLRRDAGARRRPSSRPRLLDDGLKRVTEALATAAVGRQPARPDRHPGAEGDHRPDHRRDVAARGPRRRRHGRRRARRVIPSRRRDPRASSTSAARASAPSTGCCAGCSASTPRWRSTATAPRFVRARRRQGRHGRSSTPSGPRPRTCPPRPRSTTRPPGSPGSCGLTAARR